MKLLFDWLKDFVKINKKAQDIANILTLAGAEVDEVKKIGDDYILDFEITPNRGDELSILGIAREISALTRKKLHIPAPKIEETSTNLPLDIKIMDGLTCPRFTCRIISEIEIKPSPIWIVKRLKSYGFREINNVVDITNLMMIELGQPLHAFDYDKISGHKMIIRRAKDGERVQTLDGIERILSNSAIIIEDDESIIDLAGIMGGALSEVSPKTKTIVLEAAIFNPVLIRKTSKEQQLVTDASYRFEREIDPQGQIKALNRAAELILKYAGGNTQPIIDIKEIKFKPKKIALDLDKVSSLLGIEIEINEGQRILTDLGFKVKKTNKNTMVVVVPSWRNDIKIWQDLAEEIARFTGYNKLSVTPLKKQKIKSSASSYAQKEILKDRLNGLGLSEIYSYDFLSAKDLEILKKTDENLFEIENPVAPENRYLRDSLFPSLIKVVAKNPTFAQIDIFEIGEIFDLKKGERTYLGIGLVGEKEEKITEKIERINEMTLSDLKWQTKILDEEELRRYKIKKRFVAIAEADLSQILSDKPLEGQFEVISNVKYREISKFPSVARDFAFVVDSELDSAELAADIKKISSAIVRVELFDEFVSKKLGKNKKSLAYHIQFQSTEKTLTKSEADKLSKKLISLVETKYRGKLRDK